MRRALILLALSSVTGVAAGQCPDGSRGCGGARPLPPIDRNRLAILPFRTSADSSLTYLRAGLAELLAAAFDGKSGPLAVESGEALSAWTRSRGGAAPATKSAALAVARRLGAGLVSYGSLVGSSRRFTVTVSVLEVPSGQERIAPIQVVGTEDSLAAVVASLSIRLKGRSEGAVSSSDDALRAFSAGMAAYRKANEPVARAELNRAVSLDTSFTLAAYRLVVLRALNGPSGPIRPLALRAAWSGRQRLSVEQRQFLECLVEGEEMLFRSQMLPRLERAKEALASSAEMWDVLGDLYFHVGALTGHEDWADRARHAMLRAMELDSATAISARDHLIELAFLADEAKGLSQYPQFSAWHRYLSALRSGDASSLRRARVEYVRDAMTTGERRWVKGMTVPAREVDSLLLAGAAIANTDRQRLYLAAVTREVMAWTGRFGNAAMASARAFPGGADSVPVSLGLLLDTEGLEWDRLADEGLFAQLGRTIPMDGPEACELGLSRMRRSDTTGVGAIAAAMPTWEAGRDLGEVRRGLGQGDGTRTPEQGAAFRERSVMLCRAVLGGVLASFDPSNRASLLWADSVQRFMPLNFGGWWNYDLGVAFARQGDYASAARAVRRRWMQPGGAIPRLVISLRQEGRWSALAGDTAAAIAAYRHYLVWRSTPDSMPAPLPRTMLIAQRDSVRVELAALMRAYRPRPAIKPALPIRRN